MRFPASSSVCRSRLPWLVATQFLPLVLRCLQLCFRGFPTSVSYRDVCHWIPGPSEDRGCSLRVSTQHPPFNALQRPFHKGGISHSGFQALECRLEMGSPVNGSTQTFSRAAHSASGRTRSASHHVVSVPTASCVLSAEQPGMSCMKGLSKSMEEQGRPRGLKATAGSFSEVTSLRPSGDPVLENADILQMGSKTSSTTRSSPTKSLTYLNTHLLPLPL